MPVLTGLRWWGTRDGTGTVWTRFGSSGPLDAQMDLVEVPLPVANVAEGHRTLRAKGLAILQDVDAVKLVH